MLRNVHHQSSSRIQPHLERRVFSRQLHPDDPELHQAVRLSQRLGDTHIQPPARVGTLNGLNAVDPVPPRAPVLRGGEYPQGESLGPAPAATDPDNGRNRQDPKRPLQRFSSEDNPKAPSKLNQRPLAGVRQDKARLENAREASPQPAADKQFTRSQSPNNPVVRSQSASEPKQKSVQVTLWVDPVVKEHLERVALAENLSVSAAGAAFLKRALQQNVDMQYHTLLEPIIDRAIARQMRGIATRLAWLLVRVAFDCGQTRSIVTNILGRQPGMNEQILKTILEESGRTAKSNITRRTPAITTLVHTVEKWMLETDSERTGT